MTDLRNPGVTIIGEQYESVIADPYRFVKDAAHGSVQPGDVLERHEMLDLTSLVDSVDLTGFPVRIEMKIGKSHANAVQELVCRYYTKVNVLGIEHKDDQAFIRVAMAFPGHCYRRLRESQIVEVVIRLAIACMTHEMRECARVGMLKAFNPHVDLWTTELDPHWEWTGPKL